MDRLLQRHETAMRPQGLSTRRTSASASQGSSKYPSACPRIATSNMLSLNTSWWASMTEYRVRRSPLSRLRACAIMSGERSTPMCSSVALEAPSDALTKPVPHPTSITRSSA